MILSYIWDPRLAWSTWDPAFILGLALLLGNSVTLTHLCSSSLGVFTSSHLRIWVSSSKGSWAVASPFWLRNKVFSWTRHAWLVTGTLPLTGSRGNVLGWRKQSQLCCVPPIAHGSVTWVSCPLQQTHPNWCSLTHPLPAFSSPLLKAENKEPFTGLI